MATVTRAGHFCSLVIHELGLIAIIYNIFSNLFKLISCNITHILCDYVQNTKRSFVPIIMAARDFFKKSDLSGSGSNFYNKI